jgi:hypothetical protein
MVADFSSGWSSRKLLFCLDVTEAGTLSSIKRSAAMKPLTAGTRWAQFF